jgi:hypothetical protein
MVQSSIQMAVCHVIIGVLLATQLDATTGYLSKPVNIGLLIVVRIRCLHTLIAWTDRFCLRPPTPHCLHWLG